jgi:hypothetical protein
MDRVYITWQLQGRSDNLEAFITAMMDADFIERLEC